MNNFDIENILQMHEDNYYCDESKPLQVEQWLDRQMNFDLNAFSKTGDSFHVEQKKKP